MSWTSTLLGGAFGFMIGGPLGAVVGAALGHQLGGRAPAGAAPSFGGTQQRQQRLQGAFFAATFAVMGRIAKADGRISPEEIRLASTVMDHFDLDPRLRAAAQNLFREGASERFDLDGVLAQFRRESGRQVNLRRLFLEIQIQMALADGAVSAPERRILLLVSDCLGIPRALYRRLEEQIRASAHSGPAAGSGPSLEDAYATLGVPSGASETEVKRAYRRLMSRHHPDKLVAKGLPEEMMRVATERTQEIRAAYDRIKEARA